MRAGDDGLVLPAAIPATLVLVRHGESTFVAEGRFQGRRDPPLTELGQRQATLVGTRLADRQSGAPLAVPRQPPVGIWHSPLARAAASAQIIGERQPGRPPLHRVDDLVELAQGEWEGQLMADVRGRWPAELDAWRRRPTEAQAPGGERLLDAAHRVRSAVLTVVEAVSASAAAGQADPDDAGAIASLDRDPVPGYPSGAPADAAAEPWAIIVAHDGIFRLALLALLGMPYERFWSLPFNLCAITIVGINNGMAALRAHNLSDHLAPLAEEARAAEEARGDRRGAL